MENLIVAGSNIYALLPIMEAFTKGEIFFCAVLCAAMICSFLYHMIEHHKHDMSGWGSQSIEEHRVCINLDRLTALTSCIIGLCICAEPSRFFQENQLLIFGALFLLFVSEKLVGRTLYIITHSMWHICAFHIAYLLK